VRGAPAASGQEASRDDAALALIDFVERSPAAVARHDRAAWIALFGAACVIEDPVGSRPHVAGDRAVIGRFYDTFIEPNDIVFHRGRDYVEGMSVLRELVIEIRMAPRVAISVPMFLVYDLAREGGELRILRLAAHWELAPMVMQLLRRGLRALPAALALGVRLLRVQGVAGTLGFMRAWRSAGARGKAAALRALADIEPALRPSAQARIIAAGDCVSLSVHGNGTQGVVQAQIRDGTVQHWRHWLRPVTRA